MRLCHRAHPEDQLFERRHIRLRSTAVAVQTWATPPTARLGRGPARLGGAPPPRGGGPPPRPRGEGGPLRHGGPDPVATKQTLDLLGFQPRAASTEGGREDARGFVGTSVF